MFGQVKRALPIPISIRVRCWNFLAAPEPNNAVDTLTIGYLMLDDAFGVPYYRLINVRPTTNNQQATTT